MLEGCTASSGHAVALSSSQFQVDGHTDWNADENTPYSIMLLLCVSLLLLSDHHNPHLHIYMFYSNLLTLLTLVGTCNKTYT